MQEGIEGFEALGDWEDYLYLVQVIIGIRQLSIEDVVQMFRHSPRGSNANIKQMIAFYKRVGILEGDEAVKLSGVTLEAVDNPGKLTLHAVDMILNQLFEVQALQDSQFTFDDRADQFVFSNHLLQLKWAAVRNLLVDLDFFIPSREDGYVQFVVNPEYANLLKKHCESQRRRISLEELRNKIEKEAEAGEISEKFALDFEKRRLEGTGLSHKVRQISTVDVGAGYDIVSFNGKGSTSYDRFIEVKTISPEGISFFWSRNEIEISRVKESRYYLYLVDISKIHQKDYLPMIICNPSINIESSDEWKMEAQSFLVSITLAGNKKAD